MNNLWRGGGYEPGRGEPWYAKLRTVKLQRLAWERGSSSVKIVDGRPAYEATEHGPVTQLDDPNYCVELTGDLRWMRDRCAANGAVAHSWPATVRRMGLWNRIR